MSAHGLRFRAFRAPLRTSDALNSVKSFCVKIARTGSLNRERGASDVDILETKSIKYETKEFGNSSPRQP